MSKISEFFQALYKVVDEVEDLKDLKTLSSLLQELEDFISKKIAKEVKKSVEELSE